MNREFLSNTFLIVGLNLLVKTFYLFGIDRTVQNTLPPGEYGLFFTLFSFAFLLQIIGDFGLQNYNSRHLAQSRQLLDKYFPPLLALKLLLLAAYLLSLSLAGLAWGFSGRVWGLLWWIGLNQGLLSLLLFLRSNLSGLGLYRIDSLFSVLDRALLILLCGGLLWGPWAPHFRLEWFVMAHTLAYGIAIAVAYALLRQRLQQARWVWQPALLLSLLRASAPYALVIFLMTAYTRIDAIMLERMLPNGLEEADRYAAGYRLLDAANVAGYLVAGLLLPMFARRLSQREPVADLARLGLQTLWAGAISLAAAAWFFSTPIMETLYNNSGPDSGRMMGWLLLSFVPMCGTYVYGTLLTAHGDLRRMNYLFAAGVALNFALNWWLIPDHGARGAALATGVTQLALFLAQVELARRTSALGLTTDLRWLCKLALFGLLTAGWAWACAHPAIPGLWYVKFLVAICGGGALAFLLRLLEIRALWGFRRPS